MPCVALQTSPPSTVGPLCSFKKWLLGARWRTRNLRVVWGWLRCAAGGGSKRRHVVARRSARALQCVAFNKLVLLRGNSASFVVFVSRLRVSIVLLLLCDLWLVAWVISVICVGVLIYGRGVFPSLRRVQTYTLSGFVRTSLLWQLRSGAPSFCTFRNSAWRPPTLIPAKFEAPEPATAASRFGAHPPRIFNASARALRLLPPGVEPRGF